MTTRTTHTSTAARQTGATATGSVTLALGMLFTAAVAFTYVLSLSDAFDPPNSVKVIVIG